MLQSAWNNGIIRSSKKDYIMQNCSTSVRESDQPSQALVCWIGDTDLLALGKFGIDHKIPHYTDIAKIVLKKDKEGTSHDIDNDINTLDVRTRNSSIVLTLTEALKGGKIPLFSDVILLTNRPSLDETHLKDLQDTYPAFIRQACTGFDGNISVVFVSSASNKGCGVNAWNYDEVIAATNKVLRNYIQREIDPHNIWYNITPGTIAQSTSLILLGNELSSNPNFIQVEKSRNRVDHCQIPFDINKVISNQAAHIESQTRRGDKIIGKSPSFIAALDKARQIAQFPVTVLLTGESGTGKEVFAREIHRLSKRKGKFVPINCAMLSKETGVTELTGFFRGAYTGADETRPGKYHDAIGGTLFLDEIGDCPIEVQAELLRFLQPLDRDKPSLRRWSLKGAAPKDATDEEKKYRGEQEADIRVIAATNKNVLDRSAFRQDLYYRIETIQIKIPSLETRKAEADAATEIDDIKCLADAFLENSNAAFSLKKKFRKDAYEALRNHVWTGNVRELSNVITRVVLLTRDETITAENISRNLNDTPLAAKGINTLGSFEALVSAMAREDVSSGDGGFGLKDRISEFTHIYVDSALKATNGNKKKAYEAIRINTRTFKRYL